MTAWACRRVAAVLLCALTCRAASADAAAPLGLYVGAGAGLSLLDGQPTTLDTLMGVDPAASRPVTQRLKFDPGFALVGSVGYGLEEGVRVELESDWRRNPVAGGGATRRYGLFANALYEFDPGVDWISPYVGFGLGWQASARAAMLLHDTTGTVPIAVASSTTGHFAVQAILGVAVPVPEVPGLSVTAEYRYARNLGGSGGAASARLPAGAAATRLRTGADSSHAALLGVRYAFEHEARPDGAGTGFGAAPMVGSVARTYIVYFPSDGATLTSRARDVVAEAARASTHVAHTRLSIAGHTDSTGTPAQRIAVSKARADMVADELGRWGIARDVIDVHAFGDERPAVESKPDAPEPRNRRVEIFYQ